MVVVIFYVNLLRITEITKYWKVGSGFAMESKRQYKYVSPYFCKKTKTEERNIKFAEY
jgi:hypothetical protein